MESETWRLALIGSCLAVVLVTFLVRRAADRAMESDNLIFYPGVTLLGIALIALALSYAEIRWRARTGRPLPLWRLLVGATLDVAVPFGLMYILHRRAPDGELAALTAPVLFLLPIVILLSVLRLHVGFTIAIGLLAAVGHWLLVADTYRHGHAQTSDLPYLLTYGFALALTGLAGGVLTHIVRGYIKDAVHEAHAAEQAAQQLAGVEKELDIAHHIQKGLLPAEPPPLAGFEIAGMARPAAHAGGDYYDWQMLADGRCLIAIADVTGHGIGPALVMAVCRAYARATVPTIHNAEEFLARVNNLVSYDLTSGRFITMAVALISPEGTVDILSAGHGPTFLYRAQDQQIRRFNGDGLPLGVMPDEAYTPTTQITLHPGDVIVMLTDGFMERASADQGMFGIERLEQAVRSNATKPAAEMIAAIDAEVSAFGAGTAQGDDMTIVVIRRIEA
ncbi:PP2C family protein-serine/threonine phosphatase [Nodularia spumigena]|uniref:PP2C family protein-serine/threonine phosphatase n=1 Tax=Nodularia spumigena TaxID=70799 RepID=UPI002B200424|nr:PP2C family protein-serine/threonine phosphatase [Nodularia spumigena]MEA5557631.1 PP2C family protein-serine/threonine phosphatase [Nodularia spumigena CH309]